MPVSRWMKAIDNALVQLTDLEEEEGDEDTQRAHTSASNNRPPPPPFAPPSQRQVLPQVPQRPPPPPPPLPPAPSSRSSVTSSSSTTSPASLPTPCESVVVNQGTSSISQGQNDRKNTFQDSRARQGSSFKDEDKFTARQDPLSKANREKQHGTGATHKVDNVEKTQGVDARSDVTTMGYKEQNFQKSSSGSGEKAIPAIPAPTAIANAGALQVARDAPSMLPPPPPLPPPPTPPLAPIDILKVDDTALGKATLTTAHTGTTHFLQKPAASNATTPKSMAGYNHVDQKSKTHCDSKNGPQTEVGRSGSKPQNDTAGTFSDRSHPIKFCEPNQSNSLNPETSPMIQEQHKADNNKESASEDTKVSSIVTSESTPASSTVAVVPQTSYPPPPIPTLTVPNNISDATMTTTTTTTKNNLVALSSVVPQNPTATAASTPAIAAATMAATAATAIAEKPRTLPPPSPVPGRMIAVPRKPRAARSTLLRGPGPGGTGSSSSHGPSTPGVGSRRPQVVVAAGESVSHVSTSPTRQKPSASGSSPLISSHPPPPLSIDGRPLPQFPLDDQKGVVSPSNNRIAPSPAEGTAFNNNDDNDVLEDHHETADDTRGFAVVSSSGASVGSVVVEYDNDLFYDSEGELDVGSLDDDIVDDDSNNSIARSLLDLEKDAQIDVIHQSELKDWGSASSTGKPAAVVLGPLPSVNEGSESAPASAQMTTDQSNNVNCRGVIHVRFVQAHNLPCAENTTVQPVLSLPPWKGCIRTERAVTAKGRVRGVHLTWSTMVQQQSEEQKKEQRPSVTEPMDEEEEEELEEDEGNFVGQNSSKTESGNMDYHDGTMSEITDGILVNQQSPRLILQSETLSMSLNEGAGGSSHDDTNQKYKYTRDKSQYYSMVHDYNNEDTPIPSIHLDLLTGVSLFEKSMASVTISCYTPMKYPDTIFRKWFVMKNPNKPTTTENDSTVAAEAAPEGQRENLDATDNGDGENGSVTSHDHIMSNNEANRVDRFLQLEEPLILLDIWFEPSGSGNRDTMDAAGRMVLPPRTSNLAGAGGAISDDASSLAASMVTAMTGGGTGKEAGTTRKTNKPHLFRVRSYWKPSCCALCSSVITLKRGYRCEEPTCGLDCCADCLLSIDVRLPCCSLAAKRAVHESIQRKYSLSNMMQVIAPVPEGDETTTTTRTTPSSGGDTKINKSSVVEGDTTTNRPDASALQSLNDSINLSDNGVQASSLATGIGTLHIRIEKAVLFKYAYPPEAYLEDILQQRTGLPTKEGGDHYVRVSWNNGRDSVRTRTVHQTSKPEFSGEEGAMDLIVPHYGAEYKVEVIDADSDKSIGSYLLTTHQLLQMQHDAFFCSSSSSAAPSLLDFLKKLTDARNILPVFHTIQAELRSGVKSGFGLDFYAPRGTNNNSDDDLLLGQESSRPGAINGYVNLSVCLEEDLNLMYSPSPRPAEGRPDPDFNVELIQLHVSRIMELIEGITDFFKTINYCVSWENPLLTMICLILFVYACIKFDAEYVGSIPFSFILLYMLNKARIRRFGNFPRYWVEKEKQARLDAEKKVRTSASVHRPIAVVKVMVSQGRNICSKDLGLPGRYKANVTWRTTMATPNSVGSSNKLKSNSSKDGSSQPKKKGSKQQHQDVERLFLGCTETSNLTMNPVWHNIKESDEISKLKSLLYGTEVDLDLGIHSSHIGTSSNTTNTTSNTGESLQNEQQQLHQSHRLRIRACDHYGDDSTSDNHSFASDPFDENIAFMAPILQPIQVGQLYKSSNNDSKDGNTSSSKDGGATLNQKPKLLSWDECTGSVVVQIVADNMLNKLLIYEDVVGEVEISFNQLLNGLELLDTGEYEVRGWFPITTTTNSSFNNGGNPTTTSTPTHNYNKITTTTTDTGEQVWEKRDSFSSLEEFHFNDLAEVYLCVRLSLPSSYWQTRRTEDEEEEEAERHRRRPRSHAQPHPTESEIELSAAVAEEMIRAAALAKNNATSSVIGSGINTINTVGGLLGNVQMIQNQMGNVLDKIESILNLFTWAQPHRTFVAFGAICILWLALSIVPTRALVLVGGIIPFILNFLSLINNQSTTYNDSSPSTATPTPSNVDDVDTPPVEEETQEKTTTGGGAQEGGEGSPANLLMNFIEALPTNEDLRRIYYWEGRRLGEKERQHLAKSKRDARVTKLWRALWYGNVKLRRVTGEGTGGKKQFTWETIFMLIQGHRLVWWTSEKQFDETEMPSNYMLLAGHAGLAGLSPIDMRDYSKEDLERIVNVFGRGPKGQQKISLLAQDLEQRERIEEAIIHAVTEEKRD